MEQTKKTYTLGKIRQLIDLNGDSTNFDLSFNVTCHDDTPFDVLVVDQDTLDNQELEYKKTHKTISGNIVTDKNIGYQNYFLILKSEKQCTVDVELTKKILPKPIENNIQPIEQNIKFPKRTREESGINWKKIGLISVVVIIGLGILWFLYKRKNNVDNIPSDTVHLLENPLLESRDFKASPISKASPAQSSHSYKPSSSHSYKPTHKHMGVKKTRVSPDVMSQTSHQSSYSSSARSQNNGSNSLLYRLKKFSQ